MQPRAKGVAASAAKRVRLWTKTTPGRHLKDKSIGVKQAKLYREHDARLMHWMRQQGRNPLEARGRDKAVEAYLDH
eukprot:7206018-Heterocapsa_arctica.AAC.1